MVVRIAATNVPVEDVCLVVQHSVVAVNVMQAAPFTMAHVSMIVIDTLNIVC